MLALTQSRTHSLLEDESASTVSPAHLVMTIPITMKMATRVNISFIDD
jgi:hypothetical protein